MKHVLLITLCASAAFSSLAFADSVVGEAADNTAGGAVGALSGLMVGAAVGGPAGALLGAGAGFFSGRFVQQEGGVSEAAYEVEDAAGERRIVRSPNAHFEVGQSVAQKGPRIYPVEEVGRRIAAD
jgi:hypothetical protein